ncbi:hypothetical protein LSCM1_08016 [Leishmania martiniquensis]|uniref:Fe2OG dioxygenase domain-containing protein n=1 Tax=Leishmania martiniquensis TaxID=1580590 RepID=A0A836I1R0_9TRYP|nr:hypothetical protein LSCM1_08016 [Leishmania martiniquensis]
MWTSVATSVGGGNPRLPVARPAAGHAHASEKESSTRRGSSTAASEAPTAYAGKTMSTAVLPASKAADGLWQSYLLCQRIAAGADFQNVALSHAAGILSSEAARVDAQLISDFTSILRGNAVYIRNFICDEKDMHLYDSLKEELVASTGATMLGSGGLMNWSKHQVFENPKDISQTFNGIIDMLAEYFDVDVYATRLNYYRDGTQWKPQHHDSHAYGGCALREDFTVGVSLGATRSLLFVHEASRREFDFPQMNGDCFAFTGEVNQLFTHGVPRAHMPTGDRFSIIAWGRRRTLNERNGGVPCGAAAQLKGCHINTMEDAVEVAKQLVAAPPGPTVAKKVIPPPRTAQEESSGMSTAAARPARRKKNRLQ